MKLQTKYKDTLQNIGDHMTGKWKYLGESNNGKLIDTLGTISNKGMRALIVVENGIVYEVMSSKRKKADYYYEITYEFEDGKGFYSREKKYLNEDSTSHTSCQPIPELIFYEGKFGILFVGMTGQYFDGINQLKPNRLILESGKEYLKIE